MHIKAALVEKPLFIITQQIDLLGILVAQFGDSLSKHDPRLVGDHLMVQTSFYGHSVDSCRAHMDSFFCQSLSDTLERCSWCFRQKPFDELDLFFVDYRPSPLACWDEDGVVPTFKTPYLFRFNNFLTVETSRSTLSATSLVVGLFGRLSCMRMEKRIDWVTSLLCCLTLLPAGGLGGMSWRSASFS